jgi:hypothetical protein
MEPLLVMAYIKPSEVISPKAHWRLFEAILDRGEGDCSYALGTWNGERRVGFRWNGDNVSGPLGNPQSRGLPTWTILDPALHEAVLALLPAGKRALARNFLGVRSDEERTEIAGAGRALHLERIAKIAAGAAPCALMEGARLVLHVIPTTALDATSRRPNPELFKSPERYPPIATGGRPSLGMGSWRIGFDGLLIGSNDSRLGELQRAYVLVSSSGVVEAVAKVSLGKKHEFVELPKVLQIVVRYARIYTASLSSGGAEPPVGIFVSLQNVNGVRLLQDLIQYGTIPEDIPFGPLSESVYTFSDAVFETVPGTESESATALSSTLLHMSHTAGLPSAPCFDPRGNYIWVDAAARR